MQSFTFTKDAYLPPKGHDPEICGCDDCEDYIQSVSLPERQTTLTVDNPWHTEPK